MGSGAFYVIWPYPKVKCVQGALYDVELSELDDAPKLERWLERWCCTTFLIIYKTGVVLI